MVVKLPTPATGHEAFVARRWALAVGQLPETRDLAAGGRFISVEVRCPDPERNP